MRLIPWLSGSLCLFFLSCATEAPASPTSIVLPTEPLRVMTYNVNYGLAGDPETLEAIASGDADLVFLQETNADWERALRARYGERYPHIEFIHRPAAGGMAVLSVYPFTTEEVIESPVGWFPAWRGMVETPMGKLQVLNVHLHPPLSESGSISGVITTPPLRRREMKRFMRGVVRGMPTLVVGDFNEGPRGGAVRDLRDEGLHSALAGKRPRETTWRWRVAGLKLTKMLDHIVYDKTWLHLHDVKVLREGRSDHFPVVADFRFKMY